MAARVEIAIKDGLPDVVGEQTRKKLEEAGIPVRSCRFVETYSIEADLSEEELKRLGEEAFVDLIIQEARWKKATYQDTYRIEIGFLPGITDNAGRTAQQAVYDAIGKKTPVYYSRLFSFEGINPDRLPDAAHLLHNPLVEKYMVHAPSQVPSPYLPQVRLKPGIRVGRFLLDPAKRSTLRLVRQRLLALNLSELKAIAEYFRKNDVLQRRKKAGLDERITDVELEAIAQTWSEHCKHKIFNAAISYEENGETHAIHSLFNTFIRGATDAVPKPYVLSVFKDNGGIIKLDHDCDVAIKVETHNAPSALDPYGGALTGVLGVQRDVLGTGLGAMPIASLDVLCFGDLNEKDIPKGVLPPSRIFEGVVKGIAHAGNKTGIPIVNGSILFEKEYLTRPLVYCGTIGILPPQIQGRSTTEKTIKPGYLAIMVGGRIGKDGIHGATFSSQHIDSHTPQSVVQIGDPITQKKMIDFLLEARDRRLYEAITDNGAGGLSSSIGELARLSGGCEIYLDRAPLKYPGLQPWEILLSESQERMTLAIHRENFNPLLDLAQKHEVELTFVGKFTDSGYLHCLYKDKTVAYLDLQFFHEGLPRMKLKARWQRKLFKEPDIRESSMGQTLLKLLRQPNITSKESVVRQYDHEVKGMSVLKPVGINDAAVIRPLLDRDVGIVLSHGIAPRIVQDSYSMAMLAFDEAVRNALCAGGKIGYMAALDNFSWPDPVQGKKTPDGEYKLAQLVRSCFAIYDIATAYGIPLISGKDSMKNDYYTGEHKYSILPTLLITVIAKIDDVRKTVSAGFKSPGDYIYILGTTREELGGSEYFKLFNGIGNKEPKVHPEEHLPLYKALADAMDEGLVASAHDVSDGGLAVALAECALPSGWGAHISMASLPRETEREDALLFSESPGRFVITVKPENAAAFEKRMEGKAFAQAGRVRGDKRFIIRMKEEQELINEDVRTLREAWEKGVV
ncbi:MAG TPA: phosphoribosylformylglycinamidine synthase subunit PurL [Candidatus Bilamarchaeaceae archaeon]|nr:phosphoribosylformylglycinamidine synthase subunit PurL [Candidatus Bilamarchaeaceae archaeon]